jgi:4-hydroxy-3-methylbut-2-en-1-yl diphosphate synthase IspG/GcpE
MRNIKTEYVSCPSCGRTLFDLQEVGGGKWGGRGGAQSSGS